MKILHSEKNPVLKWEHDASYMSNIEILKGFKVVNDLAEKGVRLANDLKTLLTVKRITKTICSQVQ